MPITFQPTGPARAAATLAILRLAMMVDGRFALKCVPFVYLDGRLARTQAQTRTGVATRLARARTTRKPAAPCWPTSEMRSLAKQTRLGPALPLGRGHCVETRISADPGRPGGERLSARQAARLGREVMQGSEGLAKRSSPNAASQATLLLGARPKRALDRPSEGANDAICSSSESNVVKISYATSSRAAPGSGPRRVPFTRSALLFVGQIRALDATRIWTTLNAQAQGAWKSSGGGKTKEACGALSSALGSRLTGRANQFGNSSARASAGRQKVD